MGETESREEREFVWGVAKVPVFYEREGSAG